VKRYLISLSAHVYGVSTAAIFPELNGICIEGAGTKKGGPLLLAFGTL
jgi:hypothetical protein